MLEFRNVSFRYPQDTLPMMENLSFSVEDRDFVSIIGASGCGKSTIFRLINGLEKLTEGDIHAMDKKTGQRFRNGEMPIEAVLDLHGYTLESGFDALVKFVYAQEKRGARCLLLITGKGGFLGRGVIKAEVPNWKNAPEIRSLILSYCQAKPKDGGEGAFYILLKRHRS